MKMIRSIKRAPKPVSLEISDSIILTSTGAVNLNVPFLVNHVDLFPSSFRLEAKGKVIYIDPVVIDDIDVLPADYILITHAHGDHFSIPDIRKLLKSGTIVCCPKAVYKKIVKAFPEYTIKEIKPGITMKFDILTVETVAAYNLKAGLITPHPKASMNVGYIISLGDVKLYHAGDTDYISEMNNVKDLTVAMIPIDGRGLTMSTDKAVEFINTIKPKIAIPMHYPIGTDQVDKFRKVVNVDTQVISMDGHE